MTLGDKLQKAYTKVYTKLGQQEGPVIIRKKTHAPAPEFGLDYSENIVIDLAINAGVAVSRVNAWEIKPEGILRIDDLRFTIPCNLLTEAQLDGVFLVYGGEIYTIILKQPSEIYGGVPVRWRIVGRTEA